MAPRALRPIDLAREHGLSAQAVRNYEDERILPPAARSDAGYRQYSNVHAQALRAFLALRPGFGHSTATEILRAAHHRDDAILFRVVDQAHANLLHQRDTHDEVAAALDTLTTETAPHDSSATPLTIGALAHQLGMHPASLRKWERAAILHPSRERGNRVYHADVARDARIARQLRRGGYLLPQIRLFMDQLREAGGADALQELLRQWRSRIARQSQAMLSGGRELQNYLELLDGEHSARQ